MSRKHNIRRTRQNGSAFSFQKLSRQEGEFTLNGSLMLLLVMALLILFISVFGAVNDAMKLHSVAAELARYIEIRGRTDNQVYTELDRLASVAGITIESRSIDATYFSGSQIQFGTDFTVTLNTTGRFGLGGVLAVPVPLTSTVTGRSEQYWK